MKHLLLLFLTYTFSLSATLKVIAHRGACFEAPENTLAAFTKAKALGISFIELDVHVTKDNTPVVIHDSFVVKWKKATPHIYPIKNLTLRELNTFDHGGWFHTDYIGEKAPTLAEILNYHPDTTTYLIEIKWDGPDFKKGVNTILNTVQKHGKKFLIGSIVPEILLYIHTHYPHIPLFGIPLSKEMIPFFLKAKPKAIALRQQLVNKQNIQSLHNHHMEAWAWTIDDPDHAAELHALGLDGVITNNVRRMLRRFPQNK